MKAAGPGGASPAILTEVTVSHKKPHLNQDRYGYQADKDLNEDG